MPFGLSNSPLTYMRLMNKVLQGSIGNTASIFLDDISIVSKTEENHIRKLDQVFSRLSGAGLTVKLEKCSSFFFTLSTAKDNTREREKKTAGAAALTKLDRTSNRRSI